MAAKLEQLQKGALVKGILPEEDVTIVNVNWHGQNVVEVTYKGATGCPDVVLLYHDNEPSLEILSGYKPWTYDADGSTHLFNGCLLNAGLTNLRQSSSS